MKSKEVVSITIFLEALFLALFFLSGMPVFSQECFTSLDESKAVLQDALDSCQEKIEQSERLLDEQTRERTNTEYDILLINQEINKALLRIRSSDLVIADLGVEIKDKETAVDGLNKELDQHQKFLGEVLQRINESEQEGFLTLLLTDISVSNFFAQTNEHVALRETMEGSVNNITKLALRLEASVEDLSGKQQEQGQIRQQQRAAATQVQGQKKQKEGILTYQLEEEERTKEEIDKFEDRAAQIRNRLFEFTGGAIPFEIALNIAYEVERNTGVRPAFLLGLIKQESLLGKHIGSGSYREDMHPTRDQPVFLYIAKVLGLNPDELRVSANPGFGWGGAMGPAQFIPSTWVCYGGLINEKTGTCSITGSVIKGTSVLGVGSQGSDVKRLQEFLNEQGFTVATSGPGSPGRETTKYTDDVRKAVNAFQEKYASHILYPSGRRQGTGQVGPRTRVAINQLSFYSGPWVYQKNKDVIRKHTRSDSPSNPWNPRDAFFASGIYLARLGASGDECTAARRYYAGGNWRSQVASNYCDAVLSNARLFQRDIDYLNSG